MGNYPVEKMPLPRLVQQFIPLIVARFVKMPKTRKRLIAAANSPPAADISDDEVESF